MVATETTKFLTILFMGQVSVAEAADRMGVGVQRIHRRIAEGSLRAERVGHQWVIDEVDLIPLLVRMPDLRNGRRWQRQFWFDQCSATVRCVVSTALLRRICPICVRTIACCSRV